MIRQGDRDRTCGVPVIALCLNITWELYFAVICPLRQDERCFCSSGGDWRKLLFLWLLLDVRLLKQLYDFGWRQTVLQRHVPRESRHPAFLAMMFVLLLLAYDWQYTFVVVTNDMDGNALAWATNLIMSALFVRAALTRPTIRGLSFEGALFMLVGNLAFALYGHLNKFAAFTPWAPEVTRALMIAVILLNCFYILVLWYRRAAGVIPAAGAAPGALDAIG